MRILEGLSSAHCTSGFPCISESDKTIRTPHPVKERNCEVWFIFMTWHMTEKRELFIYHSNITHWIKLNIFLFQLLSKTTLTIDHY